MSTYRDLLQAACEHLEKHGIADAEMDAWFLLAHVFGINRVDYLLDGQKELQKDKTLEYMELVRKRASHIPLQHLTGTQEFMGLEFEVNEHVLIPRQDTEILVEEVLRVSEDKSVLDLCTGSGCILISLAKLGRIKSGVGIDISDNALQVAGRNAKRLNADVTLINSDLYKNVGGKYDIIVSNPPYIKTTDLVSLMPEVRDHEPRPALEGGRDGLTFYKRIIKDLDRFLNPGGYVFFEIGYDQGEAVKEMLQLAGFIDVCIKKDFSGHDRVVYGQRPFL